MIDTNELEQIIIECLIENIEMSGAVAPAISAQTAPLSDISGFDSLRTLELLTELEVRLDCQIPSSVFFRNLTHKT